MDLYWEGTIYPHDQVSTYNISEVAKALQASSSDNSGYVAVSLQDPDSIVNVSCEKEKTQH